MRYLCLQYPAPLPRETGCRTCLALFTGYREYLERALSCAPQSFYLRKNRGPDLVWQLAAVPALSGQMTLPPCAVTAEADATRG
jgi:hypothetical protein